MCQILLFFLLAYTAIFPYLRLYSWDIIKFFSGKIPKEVDFGISKSKTLKSDSIFDLHPFIISVSAIFPIHL